MRVEIKHNVDWAPDYSYNHLVYDFVTPDSLVRARAYLDTIDQVSILGRLNPDGTARIEGRDPTSAAEFEDVLAYLRERFAKIQILGPEGYRTLATGLSAEERRERMAAVPREAVRVDLSRPGDSL